MIPVRKTSPTMTYNHFSATSLSTPVSLMSRNDRSAAISLPHAFDPQVNYPPPVIFVYDHVVRLVEGKEVKYR